MGVGLVIIGDEILSGKRVDQHFVKVIELLKKRGMALHWATYLGDDPKAITTLFQKTFQSQDIVFSCGGIGATPDDYTRQCVAEALGVSLVLHPEAKAKIQERMADNAQKKGIVLDYESPDNLQRLKMGEFPEGASIIPNPINKIPGFSIKTHYFVPGFPEMAHPMIEWALETYHKDEFFKGLLEERSVIVHGAVEARMTPLMQKIETTFSNVKVFSLPHIGPEKKDNYVELGVKGHDLESAFSALLEGLHEIGAKYDLTP